MRISYDVKQDVLLDKAYQMEYETADHFESLLIGDKMLELVSDTAAVPLRVQVAVADILATASKTTVTAAVSLLYKSNGEVPLHLEIILSKALELTDPDQQQAFSYAPNGSKVNFEFESIENGINILDVEDDNLSTTDIGLIIATIFLSLILCAVSSVLLHITGGWAAFKSKVSNCLFEEIEDDEYDFSDSDNNKSVYPVRTESYEDDDLEGASNMTSAAPESGSGILGVNQNPAAGLGIRTDDDESSMIYEGNTPVSQSSVPVGISSLRKMSKPASPEVRGGLKSAVVHRFARSAEKNK